MYAKRSWIPLGIALVTSLPLGCADAPPAQTATTNAQVQMTNEQAQGRITALERERDEARAALAQERATQEGERLRKADEASSKVARDDLEVRAMIAIDKADQDMDALREQASRSSSKARQPIDKAISDAHAIKRKLYAELRSLHSGDVGPSWDAFRATVDQSISQLQSTLAIEPDLRAKEASPKATSGAPQTQRQWHESHR